jgi:ABC-type lipoprotein release transport system permease subunit
MTAEQPRWQKILVWGIACFSTAGVLLGVATLAIVWTVMEAFRQDIRGMMARSADPEFIAATQATLDHDHNVSILILALIVLVAALNIAAGFILLMKRSRQAGY